MGLMEMTYCRRWISEIKDIAKGTIQNETERKILKKKSRKREQFELWYNFRQLQVHNMHVTRILKGKVEKGNESTCISTGFDHYPYLGMPKNILKDLMTKIFPNLIKNY